LVPCRCHVVVAVVGGHTQVVVVVRHGGVEMS
jgi:hypothetical protein